jgi:hypothetical protein
MYIEMQMLEAEAKSLCTEAKCRAEDTRIMLANLSNMDNNQHAWFEKKRIEIHQRDA